MPALSDTPRIRAVFAFLRELGLPTVELQEFEAVVTKDRNGDQLRLTYSLARDDLNDKESG